MTVPHLGSWSSGPLSKLLLSVTAQAAPGTAPSPGPGQVRGLDPAFEPVGGGGGHERSARSMMSA